MSSPHVIPTADGVDHDADPECVCGPDLNWDGETGVWVHHSLDNREAKEQS